MKKNNSKSTILVDLTNVVSPSDVYLAIAATKVDSVLTLTEETVLTNRIAYDAAPIFCFCKCDCEACKAKKPNVFKRFWNWLTRKNK